MIYILTPCSRPENLGEIRPSIPSECKWIVGFDASIDIPTPDDWYVSKNTGFWGHPVRNDMLSRLKAKPNDYILFLDDDNIIHPNWYESVKDCKADMVTWSQELRGGEHRLTATDRPQVGNIDMASFMVKYKIAKKLKFTNDYVADGLFAMDAARISNRIQVIEKHLSYYNYLNG